MQVNRNSNPKYESAFSEFKKTFSISRSIKNPSFDSGFSRGGHSLKHDRRFWLGKSLVNANFGCGSFLSDFAILCTARSLPKRDRLDVVLGSVPVAVAVATTFAPEKAAQVVLSGSSSTAEMLDWIRTGTGAEGSLRLFLPIHLRNYLVFCILSLITCGSGALILGTYQLNYMNFYVAQLIQLSVNPWLSGAIAWPIWSVLRVIGYLYNGVALTVGGLNLISLLKKQVPTRQFPQRFLLLGFGFVVADIVVKAALAPIWQKLLLKGLLG